MSELKVGMIVDLIRTPKSKDITWTRCGGNGERNMFRPGLRVIKRIYPEYVCLSDGYNYVRESIKVVKKKMPIYKGSISGNNVFGVDGYLTVGCTTVRITKKLLKDLSKIAKG